jgi:hypothetical protein
MVSLAEPVDVPKRQIVPPDSCCEQPFLPYALTSRAPASRLWRSSMTHECGHGSRAAAMRPVALEGRRLLRRTSVPSCVFCASRSAILSAGCNYFRPIFDPHLA